MKGERAKTAMTREDARMTIEESSLTATTTQERERLLLQRKKEKKESPGVTRQGDASLASPARKKRCAKPKLFVTAETEKSVACERW